MLTGWPRLAGEVADSTGADMTGSRAVGSGRVSPLSPTAGLAWSSSSSSSSSIGCAAADGLRGLEERVGDCSPFALDFRRFGSASTAGIGSLLVAANEAPRARVEVRELLDPGVVADMGEASGRARLYGEAAATASSVAARGWRRREVSTVRPDGCATRGEAVVEITSADSAGSASMGTSLLMSPSALMLTLAVRVMSPSDSPSPSPSPSACVSPSGTSSSVSDSAASAGASFSTTSTCSSSRVSTATSVSTAAAASGSSSPSALTWPLSLASSCCLASLRRSSPVMLDRRSSSHRR